VGSSLIRKLSLNKEFEVVATTRKEVDLFNLDETKDFIINQKPNIIINAAAKVGGILANNSKRVDFILENLKINMNLLEACMHDNEIKIINLGSSCIYPLDADNPINEKSIMGGKLEPTNSPYAMAKLTAIELGDALNLQYGHKVINLMPTNLYGPNDNFNVNESHVIPGLLVKFHNAKIDQLDKVEIWGDGSPLREFLFVDDLSFAIEFIIEKGIDNSLLNIGSEKEITIFNLAKKIKEVTQFDGDIQLDKTKPTGNPRKLLDSSIIKSYGWKPTIELESGLKMTYDWYLKNLDNLRN